MILTCPSCATRYFVKDDAVTAAGRTVRCASCGEAWRATAEDAPLKLGTDPATADASAPRAWRARAQAQKQTREAMAAGVAWAGLSAVFAALALAAVLLRVDVVHAFPRANAAYAALRMPVNPVGLSLEGVTGGPGLQNGRPVEVISGSLRNVEAGPRASAPLTVSLFDGSGRRQASQRVAAAAGEIAPGETRPFRAVFYDPPIQAAEFAVDFAWDAPAAPGEARPPHGAAVEVQLPRGPVPDAAPLPASNPYALSAARP